MQSFSGSWRTLSLPGGPADSGSCQARRWTRRRRPPDEKNNRALTSEPNQGLERWISCGAAGEVVQGEGREGRGNWGNRHDGMREKTTWKFWKWRNYNLLWTAVGGENIPSQRVCVGSVALVFALLCFHCARVIQPLFSGAARPKSSAGRVGIATDPPLIPPPPTSCAAAP